MTAKMNSQNLEILAQIANVELSSVEDLKTQLKKMTEIMEILEDVDGNEIMDVYMKSLKTNFELGIMMLGANLVSNIRLLAKVVVQ